MFRDVVIATFPRSDAPFAALVRDALSRLPEADPARLQRELRRWHTRAIVRPQDPLGALGQTAWYVYREGNAGIRTEEAWWREPGVATARLGEDEVFIDGDDEACRLVDRPPGGLAGVSWRELVPPQSRDTEGRWLFEPLQDGEPVQSAFDFPRADGSRRVIEYRSAWLPVEREYLCRWRELDIIDGREVAGLLSDG